MHHPTAQLLSRWQLLLLLHLLLLWSVGQGIAWSSSSWSTHMRHTTTHWNSSLHARRGHLSSYSTHHINATWSTNTTNGHGHYSTGHSHATRSYHTATRTRGHHLTEATAIWHLLSSCLLLHLLYHLQDIRRGRLLARLSLLLLHADARLVVMWTTHATNRPGRRGYGRRGTHPACRAWSACPTTTCSSSPDTRKIGRGWGCHCRYRIHPVVHHGHTTS